MSLSGWPGPSRSLIRLGAGIGEEQDDRATGFFLGSIGALVRRLLVRGWLEGIFDYRAGEVPALLTRAPAAPPRRTA